MHFFFLLGWHWVGFYTTAKILLEFLRSNYSLVWIIFKCSSVLNLYIVCLQVLTRHGQWWGEFSEHPSSQSQQEWLRSPPYGAGNRLLWAQWPWVLFLVNFSRSTSYMSPHEFFLHLFFSPFLKVFAFTPIFFPISPHAPWLFMKIMNY